MHLFLCTIVKFKVSNSRIEHHFICFNKFNYRSLHHNQKLNLDYKSIMEWYEIIIFAVVVIIGAFIRGKIYENKKNMYHNDSWKDRKK